MNRAKKQSNLASSLVILIVVALITAGAIRYYSYKTSQELEGVERGVKVAGPKQVIDETADLSPKDLSTEGWKVYQNEKRGFSFAHPENYQLLENDFTRGSLLASIYIEEPISFSLVLLQDIYIDSAQTPQISLDVVKTSKTIEQLLDHIRKVINEQAKVLEDPEAPYYGASPPEIKSVETVTIGDLKMTKVVHDTGPGGPSPIFLEYYIAHPGYIFVFSANYGGPCGYSDCGTTEKETLPKILSTFKFIEIDETADWKTYIDTTAVGFGIRGFELKYPPSWQVSTQKIGKLSTVYFKDTKSGNTEHNYVVLSIDFAPNDGGLTADEWWTEASKNPMGVNYFYRKIGTTSIGGLNAIKLKATEAVAGFPGPRCILTTQEKGGWIFDIDSKSIEENTVNEILSTFKFIEN